MVNEGCRYSYQIIHRRSKPTFGSIEIKVTGTYSFSEKYLHICGMNGPYNHVKLRQNDVQLNSEIQNPQSEIL